MNIWSGVIALDNQSLLQDLQLIDQSASWQSNILQSSTLCFRSYVNPALIPLYARVGPNLELHTSNPGTSRWLKHKLLGSLWLEDDGWDRFQTIQCPVGLLLDLDGATRPRASGPSTTNLVVYGILSTSTSYQRPPTPPVSFSRGTAEFASSTVKQELRIYATPISGSLIARAQALPDRDDTETIAGHEQLAQFLPDIHSPSPKRKRVETLFESVAQHHKRVRHKGGEAVSQLMAQSILQPSQQLQGYRVKRESEEPGLPILSKIASHRPRSLSISSNLHPNKAAEPRPENSRPSSSWGCASQLSSRRATPVLGLSTEGPTRRGSVLSAVLPPSEGKETPLETKPVENIIADNKNTITRTILTCMRLYGFNRTARPLSSKNLSHSDIIPPHIEGRDSQMSGDSMALPASNPSTDEDEFKAMYHATYRASTFALRKYLKEPSDGEDGCYEPMML
ncbi:uncharacterized protein DSM5745_04268 [Aspergillus mulundensis]|uniref:Sld7 C-terminal domain-containing protein n=1 Tax=Aspergillus mulundensis TaxID=1810919 RepID=A0A3D8SC66_9EURO|nr:Uncharacterized protein DSM5745_04268 [Aspergillus mulundensis]RDW83942.1 Uncharacterized protein DSM5745_04268 [Aspergillus mulundensis]